MYRRVKRRARCAKILSPWGEREGISRAINQVHYGIVGAVSRNIPDSRGNNSHNAPRILIPRAILGAARAHEQGEGRRGGGDGSSI